VYHFLSGGGLSLTAGLPSYTLNLKARKTTLTIRDNLARNTLPFTLSVTLLAVAAFACQSAATPTPGLEAQIQAGVAATRTKEAFVNSVESARQTSAAEKLPSPTYTPEPTITWTPSPTPTLTPEPQHLVQPGFPSSLQFYISDFVSEGSAKDKTALGDSYLWSRLERPFTAQTMLYHNYLDIYQVNLEVREEWTYFTIVLMGKLPQDAEVSFAVELDVDHDGRGDYLVLAALPPGASWTSEGVRVLEDADDDIGGLFPLYVEEPAPPGNGYEREIFNSGEGLDRDLAWARRDPEYHNQLQLAFKTSLTGVLGFLWSAWTAEGELDPALFDINDHIGYDAAGSPSKENYRYPVKEVSLMDSTCRAWYGFLPSGSEVGLCLAGDLAPQQPGYGVCEANSTISGCGANACLTYCPRNRFCIPCKLP
jgi:hypothetical protein